MLTSPVVVEDHVEHCGVAVKEVLAGGRVDARVGGGGCITHASLRGRIHIHYLIIELNVSFKTISLFIIQCAKPFPGHL